MRGHRLTAHSFAAIKDAPGPYKRIAYQYGISVAHVCRIKRGKVYPRIGKYTRRAMQLSATIATLAFVPEGV